MNSYIKTKLTSTNLALLLILFVGALVRILYLGSLPGGLHQDEAIVAWNAYSLYNHGYDSAGHVWPMYVADWGDGHSLLYCILTLPFIFLNGNHLTPFITRMPQALVGIFTILAVYGIVKRLFNEQMALWSAFLLATCPWHIMMCRWGLDANLVPGFLMFSLYFFVRGLENEKFLLLSGLFYGLTLHCYAVIWPLVPILLLIQICYGLYKKKLRINKWSIGASCILFVLALPLMLFVLVNGRVIDEIYLPFMSIPAMSGYRAGEITLTLSGMWHNFKRVLSLLAYQDTSAFYEFVQPSGLYYDIGTLFIIIGFVFLMWNLIKKLCKKEFATEFLIFTQLVGAGVICLLVETDLHQTNCLFIPLVILEAYGVYHIVALFKNKVFPKVTVKILSAALVLVYLLYFGQFEYLYFTEFKETISIWFAQAIEDCVPYACEKAEVIKAETGEYPDIVCERGIQWPRILYYTDTLGSDYLSQITYKENGIEPYSFVSKGIKFFNHIDYDNIDMNSIHIVYDDKIHLFSESNFDITKFDWWYVAVPK